MIPIHGILRYIMQIQLIFISIKIELEIFVVSNNAKRERFALRMRPLLKLQITKKQCQLLSY